MTMSSLFSKKNADKQYQYTRLGAQVQNVQAGNVYVFGEGDVCDEDEVVEYEMDNIRSRKSQANKATTKEDGPAYVERQIAEGDTLQTLSLQYGIPVSELKRVNNLIRDQDLFALTRLKIPVKQHSFLVDKIQTDDEKIRQKQSATRQISETSLVNGAAFLDSADEGRHSYESDADLTTDLSDPETQKTVIRNISINCGSRTQSREAKRFLRNMDKDLNKIMKNSRTERRSLDEVISVLTNKSVQPLGGHVEKPEQVAVSKSMWKIVIVVVLLFLLFPVVYLLYHYMNENKED